jgi:hypothetical protein
MERKLGEIFTCDGKTYQVVKGTCDDCCILHNHCFSIRESLGLCTDVSRTDKTGIIFKEINNMKIQEMIEAIKNGKKVRRECWSGDKFLYYVPSASYPARTGIENSIADKDGKVLYKEYIAIRCKDGDVGFYTPTQCDILAEDWKVIVE